MIDLTVIVVTMCERHSAPFIAEAAAMAGRVGARLIIALDRVEPEKLERDLWPYAVRVSSKGYVPSVWNELLEQAPTEHVLRIDDDERVTPAMESWLVRKRYMRRKTWRFLMANLWKPGWYVVNGPLYPNYKSSLMTKESGRHIDQIHSHPESGRGKPAPVMIEHHKLLVKTIEERKERLRHYESISPGAGSGARSARGVPEEAEEYRGGILCARLGDGRIRKKAERQLFATMGLDSRQDVQW